MDDEPAIRECILQPRDPFEIEQQFACLKVRVLVGEQLAATRVGFRSDRNVPVRIEVLVLQMIQRLFTGSTSLDF
ncbi:MAG: hypothetical protein H8E66_33730 [Planctomycetes bacterium]|nr:hypothetical protein [Planctomycetota bacterium]